MTKFCDRAYPAAGAQARRYQPAPTRALAGAPQAAPAGKGWRWINAWATWCVPCVEEMGLLTRWRDSLHGDGVVVDFELLSIDGPEDEPELHRWLSRRLPGPIQWLKTEDDFPSWIEALGVRQNTDEDAAIPIHALVDPQGQLRCVRLGSVHDQDYGAVRTLLHANSIQW